MKSRARVALMILILGSAGCGDTMESVLRDELMLESENLDRITFVVNEESAKEYYEVFFPMIREARDGIKKRKDNQIDNQDILQGQMWRYLVNKVFSDLDKVDNNRNLDRNIPTWKEIALRLEDAKPKMPEQPPGQPPGPGLGNPGAPVANPGHRAEQPKKEIVIIPSEALPSTKMLKRYARERVAFQVCKEREVNRLKNVLEKMDQDKKPHPELTKAVATMRAILPTDPSMGMGGFGGGPPGFPGNGPPPGGKRPEGGKRPDVQPGG